jgi:hypothetical protein
MLQANQAFALFIKQTSLERPGLAEKFKQMITNYPNITTKNFQ